MEQRNKVNRRIAILGDYPPRACGIATFTRDLRNAVVAAKPEWVCPVVSVTDSGRVYEYPSEVRFEVPDSDIQSFLFARCGTS